MGVSERQRVSMCRCVCRCEREREREGGERERDRKRWGEKEREREAERTINSPAFRWGVIVVVGDKKLQRGTSTHGEFPLTIVELQRTGDH